MKKQVEVCDFCDVEKPENHVAKHECDFCGKHYCEIKDCKGRARSFFTNLPNEWHNLVTPCSECESKIMFDITKRPEPPIGEMPIRHCINFSGYTPSIQIARFAAATIVKYERQAVTELKKMFDAFMKQTDDNDKKKVTHNKKEIRKFKQEIERLEHELSSKKAQLRGD